MPRLGEGDPGKRSLTFELPPDLRNDLQEHCRQTGVPQSETIRRAIRAWLDDRKASAKRGK